ncbi:MAG: LPXTG cell wall anchor domain-containing protein [Oscillospiraceae bacterium]|nr:LPXTG cell wall anchor domain-containing protein [Oscillospiraceae bacterium]
MPTGINGTITFKEMPLFTTAESRVSETPAVGVNVFIGGYTTKTDAYGRYTIGSHFNKGEYLSVSLKYDTINYLTNLTTSKATKGDFTVDVNTADPIRVASSSLQQLMPSTDATMDLSWDTHPTTVEDAAGIILQDRVYRLNLTADSSAGYTPAYAEFHIYDKYGNERTEFTQKVEFDRDKSLSLDLNPVSVPVTKRDADGNIISTNTKKSLDVGDSFTVKIYDTKGVGYYEHHTVLIVSEKLSSMYMINYDGLKRGNYIEGNTFLDILGGITKGYDFLIDKALMKEGGTFKDENDHVHQLACVGFGGKFTDADSILRTRNEVVEGLNRVNNGDHKFTHDSNLNFFGNGNWALNINIGMIMDAETMEGKNQGKLKFGSFTFIAQVEASFYKQIDLPIPGIVDISIMLKFATGGGSSGEKSGIRWYFYPKEGVEKILENDALINLLDDDNIASMGDYTIQAMLEARVDVTKCGVGVCGDLKVEVEEKNAYSEEKGWQEGGAVALTPKILVQLTFLKIPVWSKTWTYNWGLYDRTQKNHAPANLTRALDASLAMENILYKATDGAEMADLSSGTSWNKASYTDSGTLPGVTEAVLKNDFVSESGIAMQPFGNGKALAVFLDAVPGRADEDKIGAYYTIFDGKTWTAPVLLEDDGTLDYMPTICEAGSKGYLIAWSDADKSLKGIDAITEQMNALNLTGCFFDPETGTMGDIMEITRTTEEDTVSDSNPRISYYTEDGKEFMKIYFTKSEYEITDPEEGEVVGDLMHPYTLIATRSYDFDADCWSEEITGQAREALLAEGEASYKAYQEQWYGQDFLNLAPDLEISEQLDEEGYWAEGTTAQITEVQQDATVTECDAIAYNHLSLLAYVLDKGGTAPQQKDQNLCLQIYNYKEDAYHHPVILTSKDSEISNVQFARLNLADGEECTMLYYLEDGVIKRINISALVAYSLKEDETASGKHYYYVDKSRDTVGYVPPQVLAGTAAEDNEDVKNGEATEHTSERPNTVTGFKVHQSGDYAYLMWTEFKAKDETQREAHLEQQLFAARENSVNGDFSLPAQLTNRDEQDIHRFDFMVNENGETDILAVRQFLDQDGNPDESTAQLTAFHTVPSDDILIGNTEVSNAEKTDDGLELQLDVAVENRSLSRQDGIIYEVQNADGQTVYSSAAPLKLTRFVETTKNGETTYAEESYEEVPAPLTLIGGQKSNVSVSIPADENGSYDGTFLMKKGGETLASASLKGTASAEITASSFQTTITERDKVQLTATLKNESVLDGGEHTVTYGILNADGEKKPLGTEQFNFSAMAENTLCADVDIDFDTFSSNTNSDGSVTDTAKFYLDVDADNYTTVYTTAELTATADQASVMNSLTNISAAPMTYQRDAQLAVCDSFKVGDTAEMNLLVDGKIAQNEEDLVNTTKIVWDPVDSDIIQMNDGWIIATGAGTAELTGWVCPADTTTLVTEDGISTSIDSYPTMPSAMLLPVKATITVAENPDQPIEPDTQPFTDESNPENPEKNYFTTLEKMGEMAERDYRNKTTVTPADSVVKENADGSVSIDLLDKDGNVLNTYTIDPETGVGTDAEGKDVNLPQTGITAPNNLLLIVTAFLLLMIGGGAIALSRYNRKKKEHQEHA